MVLRELLARLSVKVDEAAFTRAKSKIDGLKMGFVKLGGIVSAAAAGMQLLAKETAESAREAANTAKQTGLTTQQVQGLGYAAEQSGVSAEEMRHGLIHLARSAMEAKQGSAEAALGFQQLGVRAVGADGKVRPMGELLADVTAKIAAMPDGTQKAALAMRIFGRAGAQLIPLFDKGPAGIARLTEEANKLGVVMSDGLIKSGVTYAETLGRMKGALQGLGNAIMTRLFPAMTRSTAQFSAWISAHRQWIALHVEKAFKVVTEILQSFVRTAKGVVDLFERIWRSGGLGKTTLIALGVAVTALVAPWTALAAVIALVAEDVELFFSSHGKAKTLTGLLVQGLEVLAKKAGAIWDGFKKDPFGFLYDAANGFFDWFVEQAAKLPARMGKGALGKLFGQAPAGQSLGTGGDIPDSKTGISNLLRHLFGPPETNPNQNSGATPASPLPSFFRMHESWGVQDYQNLLDHIGRALVGAPPAQLQPMPPEMAGMLPANTTFAPVFNITAPSGDAQGIAGASRKMLDDFWDSKMRAATGAVNR